MNSKQLREQIIGLRLKLDDIESQRDKWKTKFYQERSERQALEEQLRSSGHIPYVFVS